MGEGDEGGGGEGAVKVRGGPRDHGLEAPTGLFLGSPFEAMASSDFSIRTTLQTRLIQTTFACLF